MGREGGGDGSLQTCKFFSLQSKAVSFDPAIKAPQKYKRNVQME